MRFLSSTGFFILSILHRIALVLWTAHATLLRNLFGQQPEDVRTRATKRD